jgi:hypothetical protein
MTATERTMKKQSCAERLDVFFILFVIAETKFKQAIAEIRTLQSA